MTQLPRDEQYMQPGTRARFGVANRDDLRLEFGLTMSVREWTHLQRQLPSDGSAAGQLGKMIGVMLSQCVTKLNTTYESGGYSGASPVKDPS